MKAYIDEDEWYPVYDINSNNQFGYTKEVEIDDYTYKKFITVMDEFTDMQEELKRLFMEN